MALVTCSEYPDGYDDDVLVIAPLAALDIDATFVTWDDAAADWTSFDLVVLRSTWDYTPRLDEFLTWAEGVPGLVNPAAAVRWSSDKRYLVELARAGAPVIPTMFVVPGAASDALGAAIGDTAAAASRFVVKPTVGAGSVDVGLFELADQSAIEQATKHAATLLERDRAVMVQPYLDGIDASGETALIFVRGEFSHAIRKEPMLAGGVAEFEGLFGEERTSPSDPTTAQLEAADAVLDATPFDRDALLYARVDLLPDANGAPLLLELELVEPSLFLADGAGAAERFAAGIATVARGTGA